MAMATSRAPTKLMVAHQEHLARLVLVVLVVVVVEAVVLVQGAPKKMSHSDFLLKSAPEVQLYFFTCVSESEFRARSI